MTITIARGRNHAVEKGGVIVGYLGKFSGRSTNKTTNKKERAVAKYRQARQS